MCCSRIGRRSEYAPARLVGTPADPKLAVRTGRGLVERHEFTPVDDPSQTGAGDLFRRLTIVVAATPLPRRITIAALVDPGIVGGGYRCRECNACKQQ